jgi:hypothetical protein
MRTVKLNKKFIILLLIFLLFVFSCNIMNSTVEGAENLLTDEDKKIITDDCNEIYGEKESTRRDDCIIDGKEKKINLIRSKNEAKKLKDELGISAPKYKCPKVTSFYNLFAKANCLANNIRNGAQNI